VKEVSKDADIILANPCKKREDIEYAKEVGVETTVVDSREEIEKMVDCDWAGSSFVRIRVDDSGSTMPFSAKFGVPIDEAGLLTAYAMTLKQKISGISFHVGSGCNDATQFKKAILSANAVFPLMCGQQIKKPYTIDIGGGFTSENFNGVALEVKRSRGHITSNTRFIAEPGRFFAATSHDLFVKVIGKKPMTRHNGFRYTLDESLYGQFSCIPYDHAQPKWIRVRGPNDKAKRKSLPGILYGRTCDSVDLIAASESTEELFEGDWLWFPNMGAYTTVTSTEFNGFPKPPTLVCEDDKDGCLPDVRQFQDDFTKNVKYASAVSVPRLFENTESCLPSNPS
jgi:ornithine decarboxylase